jgi:hypothetical protein
MPQQQASRRIAATRCGRRRLASHHHSRALPEGVLKAPPLTMPSLRTTSLLVHLTPCLLRTPYYQQTDITHPPTVVALRPPGPRSLRTDRTSHPPPVRGMSDRRGRARPQPVLFEIPHVSRWCSRSPFSLILCLPFPEHHTRNETH